MKKYLILLLCLFLCGCGKENFDDHLQYYSDYYKGHYFQFDIVEKVENLDQIQGILSKVNRLPEKIVEKLNAYDETYFLSKNLLFIYFPTGSGAIKSHLENVTNEKDIEVFIKIDRPEVLTWDHSGHLYFIEIDKSEKELKVYTKTNEEEFQRLEKPCESIHTAKATKVKNEEYQTVTFKSTNSNEMDTHSFDYKSIQFQEGKLYKFHLIQYREQEEEAHHRYLFGGAYIVTQIEETEEIINQDNGCIFK